MHFVWLIVQGIGWVIVSCIVMLCVCAIIRFSIVTYFEQKEEYIKRIMPGESVDQIEDDVINNLYH